VFPKTQTLYFASLVVFLLLLILTSPQQWALQVASSVAYPVGLSSEGKVWLHALVKSHRTLIPEPAVLA
jgi:hypothetical protein